MKRGKGRGGIERLGQREGVWEEEEEGERLRDWEIGRVEVGEGGSGRESGGRRRERGKRRRGAGKEGEEGRGKMKERGNEGEVGMEAGEEGEAGERAGGKERGR